MVNKSPHRVVKHREAVSRGQVKACDLCGIQPQRNDDLCIACERHSQSEPRLKELRSRGSSFNQGLCQFYYPQKYLDIERISVRAQFNSEWEGDPPNLDKVYEVVLPRDIRKRHDAYRYAVL